MIKDIKINNFQNFDELKINQLSSLNVIIGENDTGKTGLLKLLYASTKGLEDYFIRKKGYLKDAYKNILSKKLIDVFQPSKNGLSELVTKGSNDKLIFDCIYNGNKSIYYSFGTSTNKQIQDCSNDIDSFGQDFNALFIPAKEILSIIKPVEMVREKFVIEGYDDTYYDMIKSLRISPQPDLLSKKFKKIQNDLEAELGGKFVNKEDENRMVYKKGNTEFSISLTAEGLKKLGTISLLLQNNEIKKGTVLFVDEPENNLHPKLIRIFASYLHALSKEGVQIFLSTHSYFMIKQLSIIAQREKTDITCISLDQKGKRTGNTPSNLIDGLPDNPIIRESLEMFDEESDLI